MKTVLATIAMIASVNAFAGYTAEVCQINEAGAQTNCRMVYFDRDLGVPSKYNEPVVCDGEGQNTICDKPSKVPAILSKLNQWFLDHGFTAPEQVDPSNPYIGGPN